MILSASTYSDENKRAIYFVWVLLSPETTWDNLANILAFVQLKSATWNSQIKFTVSWLSWKLKPLFMEAKVYSVQKSSSLY